MAVTALPLRRRTVRLPLAAYALLIVAVFAGSVATAMATGAWQTSGRTTAGGERVAPQGVNVTEIKGWMAIGDVAAAWSVPLPELLLALGLPAETPPSAALKDLESGTFSVTALRTWLAARRAAPSASLAPPAVAP